MKEKLVTIEDKDYDKLEQIWRETGATTMWQIRQAIKEYLKKRKK